MERVVVAEQQPELVAEVEPDLRDAAVAATMAPVLRIPHGPWPQDERSGRPVGHFGLYVLEGLLARRVHLGTRACVELLGAGDVLRPWASLGENSSIELDARWTVQSPIRVAVLDRAFATRVAPYPEISAAIMDRLSRRSRWLGFHLAVCQLPSLSIRLRLMTWYLADRWGKVTPEGVVIPLRLTHELLGGLVGARRPAVTTTLGELTAAGHLARRPDGTWLLLGEPPPELEARAA